MTARHILVVGNGRELPAMIHSVDDAVTTSMLVRTSVLKRVQKPDLHAHVLGVSSRDPSDWIAAASAIDALRPVTHIASFGEKDQDKAADVAAALGLTMHSRETVRVVHDKVAMRCHLRESGIPGPAAVEVRGPDHIAQFAAVHGYPVVVKPVAGAASSGVSVVRTAAAVTAAWDWGRAATEPDRPDLMVEAFLDGAEVSVEAFSDAGEHHVVAVTEKLKDAHHCVERGHLVRPYRGGPDQVELADYVRAVLDALGVRDGVTHTEVMRTEAGPRVVETHLRPAGDEIPEMIRDALGIDLLDLLVRQSIGQDIRAALDGLAAALALQDETFPAIWYDSPARSGRLRAVEGIDDARQLPGIVDVTLEAEIGDEVRDAPRDSRDRVLAVKAVADRPERALALAQAAAARVVLHVDDGTGADPEQTPADTLALAGRPS